MRDLRATRIVLNPRQLLNRLGDRAKSAPNRSIAPQSELWKTNGTTSGTSLIKDVLQGPGSSHPFAIATVGNVLFFAADDGVNGKELWKTDGTTSGTVLVKNIAPGDEGSVFDPWFSDSWSPRGASIGDAVFFAADDGEHGQEIWKSDGTANGTSMVADVNPKGSSLPSELTVFEGSIYFRATDGVHGSELWRTDENGETTLFDFNLVPTGGSVRVDPESVNSHNLGSYPGGLTLAGSKLFFAADDGVHGRELWKVERTDTGSHSVGLVKDIGDAGSGRFSGLGWDFGDEDEVALLLDYELSVGSSELHSLTALGDSLVFVNQGELWISDGTEDGTSIVKDINTQTSSSPRGLTTSNGVLYFSADDGSNGYELWRSDGTPDGTTLVKDIHPGMNSSWPSELTAAGDRVYFVADEPLHGAEIWKSDGTELGTAVVTNMDEPEFGWFAPEGLFASESRLFFNLWDSMHGVEPWVHYLG